MQLFSELQIRGVTLRNRIAVSPMCEYSSVDGFANDWHLVHLGARAVGGAAIVFTEATAVTAEGRISPEDLGIWKNEHVEELSRITRFIRGQGALAGIQLAHAGRKGSTHRPWDPKSGAVTPSEGGWTPVGPTSAPFEDSYPTPAPLTVPEIAEVVQAFRHAAKRALDAGFDVIELHAAHGYLIHEFLSPLSNTRTDDYGGSFENRTRLAREVLTAVREVWPDSLPLFVRISATDWVDGGWDVEQSVALAKQLAALGADVIDCSTGGNVATAKIPVGPGYQVQFAERVRREGAVKTAAVGLITTADQAEQILVAGQADVIVMGRELLRQPNFPLLAAAEKGETIPWPAQYLRAGPRGATKRD